MYKDMEQMNKMHIKNQLAQVQSVSKKNANY